MPELGKVGGQFFREEIYPHLGADREDVYIGPQAGVDFGVLDVGGQALVLATDPLSLPPGLGFERAGRFALDICLADVAVSGIAPSHIAVGFSLPPELTDEQFAAAWRAMDDRARELGVSVATGHTARYAGVQFPWVGAATVLGVGDHDDVIRPDGAQPGDALLVTTGPAGETAGLFASMFPEQLDLDAETVAAGQARLDDVACVEDALALAAFDTHAMHDATECGVQGGLVEMADSAGVRIDIDRDAFTYGEGVRAVCDAIGVDPLQVTSSGTLLVAIDPTDAERAVERLAEQGTPAAVVGTVSDGEGVFESGERLAHPGSDPSWAAYDEYRSER
ncbi:AIR synthase family protein [Halosegnis longus]|uniref:Hydrogenase expression protein n=1 Tax=Halosegnis longus TaxID=2216012 RepID=A0AAJ4R6P6_9EURY|nr:MULTISPECIES: AIR synthase family protein [Halobacteriales]RNJ25275.1 hydrogenase expression protein [Salella cibi]